MSNYREIVTKAIKGKGKKSFKNKYSITAPDYPSNILGCWIINHKFNGYERNENIIVEGSFDINLWYSTDNDTKTNVINKTIKYNEEINVKPKMDIIDDDSEVIVRALKQPTCSNATISGNNINFDIEKELGIEIVGDTKVKIMTEDYDDEWQIFSDEESEVLDEIENEVNEETITEEEIVEENNNS